VLCEYLEQHKRCFLFEFIYQPKQKLKPVAIFPILTMVTPAASYNVTASYLLRDFTHGARGLCDNVRGLGFKVGVGDGTCTQLESLTLSISRNLPDTEFEKAKNVGV
jgi:hypothetical protein